jgi:hypothetical protein
MAEVSGRRVTVTGVASGDFNIADPANYRFLVKSDTKKVCAGFNLCRDRLRRVDGRDKDFQSALIEPFRELLLIPPPQSVSTANGFPAPLLER